MPKRLPVLLLTLALLLTLLPPAALAKDYTDVPAGHWAASDISAAREANILTGVSSQRFGLGQPMTRAAFATAVVRLFGWEKAAATGRVFSDVPAGAWYAAAVETAVAEGAVPTYTGAFRPTDPITREEMVVMLVRALGYSALAAAQADRCRFADVTSSQGYITLASDLKIVSGYKDGTFRPRAAATREQAAAVLMRLYRLLQTAPQRLDSAGGYTLLVIPTPAPADAAAVPATPLEPLESLYTLLRERREAGADLSRAALSLTPGGWETVVEDGVIVSSRSVSKAEVEAYLNRSGVSAHYAERYACSYLTVQERGRSVTVWFQSEESVAAKLRLAGLFGVTLYTC